MGRKCAPLVREYLALSVQAMYQGEAHNKNSRHPDVTLVPIPLFRNRQRLRMTSVYLRSPRPGRRPK